MVSSERDINDTRCRRCGLIQPCPCQSERSYPGAGHKEKGIEEPIIIINHRRKRRNSEGQGENITRFRYFGWSHIRYTLSAKQEHERNVCWRGGGARGDARRLA